MKKKDFILSSVTSPEVAEKIDVEPILDSLNQHIRLSSYGSGIQHIFFTFLAVPPDDIFHENDAFYDEDTKTVEVALRLSYPHLKTASRGRVIQMMAATFLVSVDLYDNFNLANFNMSEFREDLQKLFEKEGWLIPVENE